MARVPPPVIVAHGRALPYRGRQVVLVSTGPGRRPPVAADGRLQVSGSAEGAPRKALAFLKAAARDALAPAARGYAARLDRQVARVTLRDTRSRWGSCAADGALSFSWRLAMAPPEVLDYVAAHEAAHLVEMNHSPAFWAVVARLRPDWEESRDWLRAHGPALHRVRFDGGG